MFLLHEFLIRCCYLKVKWQYPGPCSLIMISLMSRASWSSYSKSLSAAVSISTISIESPPNSLPAGLGQFLDLWDIFASGSQQLAFLWPCLPQWLQTSLNLLVGINLVRLFLQDLSTLYYIRLIPAGGMNPYEDTHLSKICRVTYFVEFYTCRDPMQEVYPNSCVIERVRL